MKILLYLFYFYFTISVESLQLQPTHPKYNEANECIICYDKIKPSNGKSFLSTFRRNDEVILPCGHSFHRGCIRDWGRNCPICRGGYQLCDPVELLFLGVLTIFIILFYFFLSNYFVYNYCLHRWEGKSSAIIMRNMGCIAHHHYMEFFWLIFHHLGCRRNYVPHSLYFCGSSTGLNQYGTLPTPNLG